MVKAMDMFFGTAIGSILWARSKALRAIDYVRYQVSPLEVQRLSLEQCDEMPPSYEPYECKMPYSRDVLSSSFFCNYDREVDKNPCKKALDILKKWCTENGNCLAYTKVSRGTKHHVVARTGGLDTGFELIEFSSSQVNVVQINDFIRGYQRIGESGAVSSDYDAGVEFWY